MNKHDLEKYQLEKAAIDLFIQIYNENSAIKYVTAQKRERPDFLLLDSIGNSIGMEIAHVFYDSLEAKMLLNKSDEFIHGVENLMVFINEFNKVLSKKCTVRESFEINYQCSLLIRNTSPIFTFEDIRNFIQYIEIPNNNYKDIWILSRNNRSVWILMRLDLINTIEIENIDG